MRNHCAKRISGSLSRMLGKLGCLAVLQGSRDVTAVQRSGIASKPAAIRRRLYMATSIGAALRMKVCSMSPSATALVTGMSRFRRSVTDILSPPPPVEAMGKVVQRSCRSLSMRMGRGRSVSHPRWSKSVSRVSTFFLAVDPCHKKSHSGEDTGTGCCSISRRAR